MTPDKIAELSLPLRRFVGLIGSVLLVTRNAHNIFVYGPCSLVHFERA